MINYWISKNAFSSLKVTLTAIFQKRNFMARVFCIHCCIVDKSFLFSFFFCKLQFWGLQGPLFREIWKKAYFQQCVDYPCNILLFLPEKFRFVDFFGHSNLNKKVHFQLFTPGTDSLHNVRLLNQGAIGNTLY